MLGKFCACVNSVYQAFPLSRGRPGNEAMSHIVCVKKVPNLVMLILFSIHFLFHFHSFQLLFSLSAALHFAILVAYPLQFLLPKVICCCPLTCNFCFDESMS